MGGGCSEVEGGPDPAAIRGVGGGRAGSGTIRLLPGSSAAHKSRWRGITQPGKMQLGLAVPSQGGWGGLRGGNSRRWGGTPFAAALGGEGVQDAPPPAGVWLLRDLLNEELGFQLKNSFELRESGEGRPPLSPPIPSPCPPRPHINPLPRARARSCTQPGFNPS